MTTTPHLTPDDLDALLVGSMSASVRTHLGECALCRSLATTDRAVITVLERLPRFSPSPGFSDRVMARVSVAKASSRSILGLRVRVPTGRRAWLAAAVGVLLLAGLTTSVVWSLGNRDVLAGWGQQTLSLLDGWLWLGVQTLAANLTEQPWYQPVRSALGTPARLAVAGVAIVVTWSAGMLALKRLVALPSRTA
ncbi:MAG TPA: hypothetical protein VGA78_00775 [Gemmatimonadales bacterium]